MLWRRKPERGETADEVIARLEEVADDLEGATSELRSLVSGLRITQDLPHPDREANA